MLCGVCGFGLPLLDIPESQVFSGVEAEGIPFGHRPWIGEHSGGEVVRVEGVCIDIRRQDGFEHMPDQAGDGEAEIIGCVRSASISAGETRTANMGAGDFGPAYRLRFGSAGMGG